MAMNNFVSLVSTLSDKDLLRGDESRLLDRAQADPHFGAGFVARPLVSYDTDDNVNYVLMRHNDFSLVIFPGSKMVIDDWATDKGNFNVRKIDYAGGKIHKGFWNKLCSYWSDLLDLLNEAPHKRVILAGHSRGGAMAVIAALRFCENHPNERLAAVITIGQPSCVDSVLAETIDNTWGQRYVRVVNSTDLVPLVPSQVLGYVHAGNVWFYNNDGNVTLNPSWNVQKAAIWRDNPIFGKSHGKRDRILALFEQGYEMKKCHGLKYYEKIFKP